MAIGKKITLRNSRNLSKKIRDLVSTKVYLKTDKKDTNALHFPENSKKSSSKRLKPILLFQIDYKNMKICILHVRNYFVFVFTNITTKSCLFNDELPFLQIFYQSKLNNFHQCPSIFCCSANLTGTERFKMALNTFTKKIIKPQQEWKILLFFN